MMNQTSISKVYRLTMTALTPLHIGTGRQYIRDYDYMTRGNQTWILNQEACAELVFDQNQMNRQVLESPFSKFLEIALQPSDYRLDNPVFRYQLDGLPDSSAKDAKIWETIKDMWDTPYLPGASVKGAIRTAFFIRAMREGDNGNPVPFRLNDLDNRPKFAANRLEEARFSGNPRLADNRPLGFPYKDIFRTIQVSDLAMQKPDNNRMPLYLINVKVWNSRSVQAFIPLEAIRQGVTFTGTLKLDKYLLDNNQMGWGDDQLKWVRNIRSTVMKSIYDRLDDENQYWTNHPTIRTFYDGLIQQFESLPKDEFLLQVGWGGGWNSKTLNHAIPPQQLTQIVSQYSLDKNRGHDVFPNTRRIILRDARPLLPLGWVKVKMEEQSS